MKGKKGHGEGEGCNIKNAQHVYTAMLCQVPTLLLLRSCPVEGFHTFGLWHFSVSLTQLLFVCERLVLIFLLLHLDWFTDLRIVIKLRLSCLSTKPERERGLSTRHRMTSGREGSPLWLEGYFVSLQSDCWLHSQIADTHCMWHNCYFLTIHHRWMTRLILSESQHF